jgi:outer membrane receptor protein involved in Fe transport
VGVRYFEDDRTSDDLASGTTQAGTFDALSPRIYARYELSDDVSIYANVAKGFRSGGFAGITGVNPYEPDTVWSYEAGVKASRIFDGLLSLDLTLYYSDYKNIQEDSVTLVNGAFTQFTINGGDAEIKGLDWNLSAYPTSDLTLGVSGNYVDTKYVAITGIGTHAVGYPLDMIPDHQISFWGQFDFDIFSDGEGFIRADYSRQGKAFWRERSVGPWYVSNSDILNTFNMRIGGRWENFSAEFFVQNITNDRGFVDPLSVIELAVRSRPRTIGIRFGVDFD